MPAASQKLLEAYGDRRHALLASHTRSRVTAPSLGGRVWTSCRRPDRLPRHLLAQEPKYDVPRMSSRFCATPPLRKAREREIPQVTRHNFILTIKRNIFFYVFVFTLKAS